MSKEPNKIACCYTGILNLNLAFERRHCEACVDVIKSVLLAKCHELSRQIVALVTKAIVAEGWRAWEIIAGSCS